MRPLALACAALAAFTAELGSAQEPGAIDRFHPDHQPGADGVRPPMPAPAWGGTIRAHIESLPPHVNLALTSSSYARRVLEDVHAWMLRYDPITLEVVPELAESVAVEDALFVGDSTTPIVGKVRDAGEQWIVEGAGGEARFAKAGVRCEPGTVFTIRLREGVRWQDGHPLDAADVVFSWSIYSNPDVRCDQKRWTQSKVLSAVALDARTVRFAYARQYYNALIEVGDLFLLPRHRYDPTDPDHARADPEFHARHRAADPSWKPGPRDIAECVNENPRNRMFVGLGPYRIARWEGEVLELSRWDGYFDPSRAGYVDRISWREVRDFGAAFRALLDGELDFVPALTTDDFFSETAASEKFRARWYTGTHASRAYWYVGWNLRLPKLADVRVRRALALLADLDGWGQAYYRGLAERMSGPFLPGSPAADPTIKPLPFDPPEAERLLTAAGWIDRDGDGVRDRDGAPLSIELLMQSGNAAANGFAARFQEELARAGVKLTVQTLDWKSLDERRARREFEAIAMAWSVAAETDPEPQWHSLWAAPDVEGSNSVGLADPAVDRLIEAGHAELDFDARQRIWRALHARLFELQPYLFCYAPMRKYALSRSLRGFRELALEPGWSLRDLYYPAGTPGTRERPNPR